MKENKLWTCPECGHVQGITTPACIVCGKIVMTIQASGITGKINKKNRNKK